MKIPGHFSTTINNQPFVSRSQWVRDERFTGKAIRKFGVYQVTNRRAAFEHRMGFTRVDFEDDIAEVNRLLMRTLADQGFNNGGRHSRNPFALVEDAQINPAFDRSVRDWEILAVPNIACRIAAIGRLDIIGLASRWQGVAHKHMERGCSKADRHSHFAGDDEQKRRHRNTIATPRPQIGGEAQIFEPLPLWIAQVLGEGAMIIPRPGCINHTADGIEFRTVRRPITRQTARGSR
jgi:hypothetical protein